MTAKSSKTQTKKRASTKPAAKPTTRKSAKTQTQADNKVSQRLKAAKELQRNEEKKARPEHVVNLINDALWLFGLVITILSGHFPGQLQHGRPCMVAQRSQKP